MTSPRGPSGHTLCLLLLVTAACLWLPGQGTTYQDFLKKHQDDPKTNLGRNSNYCKQMMRLRHMKCQWENTFIHASEEQLRSICHSRGQTMEGNTVSKTLVPITVCRRRRFLHKVCRRQHNDCESQGPVMPPKHPRGQALCPLLLVAAACPWLACCVGTGYDEFLKRHVDYPKSHFGDDSAYCEEMMQGRGLLCWRGNTFLHASQYELLSLCSSRGHLAAEMEKSPVPFPITICSRTGRKPHTSCSYKGESLTKEIFVTCLKGLPVHFNKYG
ncbi:UNVERIFIED_CONTAM: hypothetical protein K2H54_035479 [Gekko kuhli]